MQSGQADNHYKARGAAARYEDFTAVPEQKYGDSFAKVQNQLEELLNYLRIPPTEENQKAASVLSRNGMDVTGESISRVSALMGHFTRLTDSLHPCAALSLFRDGLNPQDMEAGEILRYMEDAGQDYGGGYGGKTAAILADLDKSGEMDSSARKFVIGLYRMLHTIQKRGGYAFGAVIRHEKRPTLGNLLAAAKSYQYKPERMTNRADRNEHPRFIHLSHPQKHGQAGQLHHAETVHRLQDQQRKG